MTSEIVSSRPTGTSTWSTIGPESTSFLEAEQRRPDARLAVRDGPDRRREAAIEGQERVVDHEGAPRRAGEAPGRDQVPPVDEERGVERLAPEGSDVRLVSPAGLVKRRFERVRPGPQGLEVPRLGAVLAEREDGQPKIRPEPVDRVEHRQPARSCREEDQVRRRALSNQILSAAAAAVTGLGSAAAPCPALPPVIDSAIA